MSQDHPQHLWSAPALGGWCCSWEGPGSLEHLSWPEWSPEHRGRPLEGRMVPWRRVVWLPLLLPFTDCEGSPLSRFRNRRGSPAQVLPVLKVTVNGITAPRSRWLHYSKSSPQAVCEHEGPWVTCGWAYLTGTLSDCLLTAGLFFLLKKNKKTKTKPHVRTELLH